MTSEAFSKIERELLAHSSWVRRLARSLVASEADAEEIVQDTWVAALRRPPGDASSTRPWLARVVRNLAARRWRRIAVSIDSLDALEPSTSRGSDDALELAARLETQRILVEELQALSESARRVIVLRYFDGLDSAEIARRTGEAHGTVRWRLHEALSELRTRLDRRHGGSRDTWMRALTFGAPSLALPQPHAPRLAHDPNAPHSSSAQPTTAPHSTGASPTPSAPQGTNAPRSPSAPHTADALRSQPASHAPSSIAPHAASAPLVPASLAASTGIIAVNTFVKIAVAITVVLALSVGVYVARQDAPIATATDAPASVQAAPIEKPHARESIKPELAEEASGVERAPVEAPSAAPSKAASPTAPPQKATLVARAIDESLRPLAGAWISTDTKLSQSQLVPASSALVARAGGDGELRLDVDPQGGAKSITNGAVKFVAGCDGFATRWLRVKLVPGGTAYAGDIVFAPAGSVAGRVVDERGIAVAGAEITVTTPSEHEAEGDLELMRVRGPEIDLGAPSATSGDDGTFRVAGVTVGLARVWARASGTKWSVSAPIEIAAHHETSGIELALERELAESEKFGPIEGVVLAPDETPVKSPKINVLFSQGNSRSSSGLQGEASGHFKIVPLGRGLHELTFSDRDARFSPVRLENVAPGTHGLVVHLGEPKPIAIVVRSHGESVTDFKLKWREVGSSQVHAELFAPLEASASREASKSPKSPNSIGTKHPDGRAILMAPPSNFTFVVDADGYLPKTMGPYDGTRAPAEIEVGLEPVPGVHGRVLAMGEPLAGARVWMQTYGRHMKVQVNEFDLWVDPNEQFATTTDAEGRFRVGLQSDGEYMLFAEASGWAKCELGPLELAANVGQKGIDLVLDKGGAIEGRVLMAPGRNAAGTIVGVNHGEGKPRTQTVGPDGRFRFELLTPGKWKVMRCHSDFAGSTSTAISSGDEIVGGTIDTNCVVESGRTTTFDIDLRDNTACVLDVALSLNGTPAKAWSLTLWPSTAAAIARALPHGATDSQGRARIELDEPGEYEVNLVPPPEDATALAIKLTVDVARGTTPLVHDLKTGRIEGAIASWRDDSEHGWRYESGSGADFHAEVAIHADSSGHFVLPIVPIGPGSILHDIATEPHTGNFVEVATVNVEAGKTASVSVP